MAQQERFPFATLAAVLIVAAIAATTRFGYIALATDHGHSDPAWQVQGEPPPRTYPPETELRGKSRPTEGDDLVHHLRETGTFSSLAPLAAADERTAHVAPGYYWLWSNVSMLDVDADAVMRWGQAALGVLTVVCYYFFASRAFGNQLVGFLAALLGAVHPFWILNTGELSDGVLATFLLAAALMLGARGSQAGGVFTSLVFGLALGGLAMVRAALLPFAVVGLVWFLLRCRHIRLGWLCALLACLGFANMLAPWAVRNFRTFGLPVPVADSAYLHLWMGNNPLATGGPLDEVTLRNSLPDDRRDEILKETNQERRYALLAPLVFEEVAQHPQEACTRRIQAALTFLFGENWFRSRSLALVTKPSDDTESANWLTTWLDQWAETALQASLLVLMPLGLLGWRFSFGWRKQSRMAALAAVWLPLPYVLAHAALLSGPRLPLDGVLICFAAFAVAHLDPKLPREPRPEGEEPREERKEPRKKKSKSADFLPN